MSIESTEATTEVSETTIETIAEGNSTEEASNSIKTTEATNNSESSKTLLLNSSRWSRKLVVLSSILNL